MITISARDAASVLSALKAELEGILDLFDAKSRIFYVDYPVHSNIGDLLINTGTEQFFSDHDVPILKRFSVMNMPAISSLQADGNTTFLCHGGGNFGDLYLKHQRLREMLLERFPQARIVFLPQSIHFSSPTAQRVSFEKIAAHRNCHVLVRDDESFQALREAKIAHCAKMPDMAHQLWGKLKAVSAPIPGNQMHFLRRDPEATAPPTELVEAFSRRSYDWRQIVSGTHRALAGSVYLTLKGTGRAVPGNCQVAMWYKTRDLMIHDAISFFSRFELVYTNRLHAMLLALLLGRDVVAFDNSYGKSSRYVHSWLKCAVPHSY